MAEEKTEQPPVNFAGVFPADELLEKILEDVFTHPADTEPAVVARSALADQFEELDQLDNAAAVRFLTKNKCAPYGNPNQTNVFAWFNKEKVAEGYGDVSSDLPKELFEALTSEKPAVANHKVYTSYKNALGAVLIAWATLPKEWRDQQ